MSQDLFCVLNSRSIFVLLVADNGRNLLGEGADRKKKHGTFHGFHFFKVSICDSRPELDL